MSDDTHECPAPECDVRVPYEMLACRAHWYALPKPLRDRIWRTWRSGDTAEHADAVAAAIDFYEGR